MPVSDTHVDYAAMLPRWTKMFDVCKDEKHVHDKGVTYLPILDQMTDDEYEAYVARAIFVPFTSRIIRGFTGMVMRKPVMVSGADQEIVARFIKNVDGKGTNIDLFTGNLIHEYEKYSRGATLVEMPVVNDELSLADAEKNGILPKFVTYDVFSVINWRTKVVNNVEVLDRVVLAEEITIEDPGDEFAETTETQYRVLDLFNGEYRQRVFNAKNELASDDIYPLWGGKRMKFIPLVIHGGIEPQFPGLIGVADLNFHHYKKSGDRSHGEHYTALPTPYATGVDPDDPHAPKTLGPAKWLFVENPEAKVGMLEFTGQGLGTLKGSMEEIVEMIVMLTSRILAPQQVSNETALGAAIRSSNETSTLAGDVSAITSDVTKLLKIAVGWAGANAEEVEATINKDFIPIQLSGADAMAFMTNWIKGAISFESLFEIYKKGELVPADRDIEDEKKAIEAEGAVRRALEVEMAEKLGKAAGVDESLADEGIDNNFK